MGQGTTEAELNTGIINMCKGYGLDVQCISSGNLDAELAIIAAYPGPREIGSSDKIENRTVLFGESGNLLWDRLGKKGIYRSRLYATNVIKRQMARTSEDEDDVKIENDEFSLWERVLDWELDQLPNLKYVLVLGKFALRAIMGKDNSIMNWRGSIKRIKVGRSDREVTGIFTYNPAHIKHDRRWEPIFRFDIDKVDRAMSGDFRPYIIKAQYNLSARDSVSYIRSLHSSAVPISFDTENLNGETACIGFATDPHEGTCINLRGGIETDYSNRFSLREEVSIRLALQDLFNDDELQFIAQHGNYDSYWMLYKDRIRARVWYDTLLAHHTLYPTWPHGLGFLTSQYTDHPFYKDEGQKWKMDGDINTFWEYNVKDCCITYKVHERTHLELIDQGLERFFFDHVMRLQRHLVGMTVGGVKVDEVWKDKVAGELAADLDIKLEGLRTLVGSCTGKDESELNPGSWKQLQRVFFDDLKLIGRGKSTNAANRARMRMHRDTSEDASRMLFEIDGWKEDKKFHGTYATSLIDEDGRFRCEYKQFGVREAPGRLSSAKVMWGTGGNLQNQPKRAYPMFTADDGYMFTYFDLSQAEARVVAYKWKVRALIEAFAKSMEDKSFDVHRTNAARIFRVEYDDVPTEDHDSSGRPTIRFLGKRCVHGLNYRMGPDKLAEVCGIPFGQAEEAYRAYHLAFPQIRQAWSKLITEVRKNGMLWSTFGRRLIILEMLTNEAMESIVAFDPQSTIGDKVCECIYLCHEDEEWPDDARIVLNLQDALIAMHRPVDGEIVRRIMKTHAEKPLIIHDEEVVIPAEFMTSKPDEGGVHRWSTLS